MKIVRGQDAHKFQNAETCAAFEYETDSPEINLARIEVRGQYPVEGSAINAKVTELVYVELGEGAVSVNDVLTPLTRGDVVLIEKGERVWWEGNLDLVIACTPVWTKEQYISK